MKRALLTSAFLTASALCSNATTTFLDIASVSVAQGSEFFNVDNLIQGSGVGFDVASPHDQVAGDVSARTWLSDNSVMDYFDAGTIPIIVFDLGSNVLLSEISTWGHTGNNANGASEFSLRFATDTEGTGGFGTSITFNPSFIADLATAPRDSNVFSQNVNARYVELTITDNYFDGVLIGGDRVGLGEVAFAIPEPGSFALLGLAGAGLLLRRKRS